MRDRLAGLRKRARGLLPKWAAAEISVLLALVGVATGLLVFAYIADEVVEGETHALDEAILLAFRSPGDPADPLGPAWLEIAVRDLTALGSTTVLTLVTLITVGFFIVDRKRATAAFVLLAVVGGALMNYLLKIGFDRPRPDLVAHLVDVHTLSFPSGHAMGSAVTYLTLGVLIVRSEQERRIKAYVLGVAVGLTLLIGISRLYLGVHWPTDVAAGWCAGGAWALLCWLIALVLQREGRIEPGDAPPDERADARRP
ncbi:phosphatase PAP2 family protein [Ancylobacter sp. MQZ15Z-1]|uniref:Phosphatase PAP2 family protein n=1 Tax=Ancylobacter mangrovi TaxID=2972472 RepID=A0A9X2PG78_9HYPH|nr:phosphatase PAP2 family protein [Ancylobacter mangrovi]MCS0496411.1 phosphatase PAP2 family protein [Ancylobacter mangrovi]